MGKRQRVRFYFVHNETGQRYPVGNDDLVIGKTSGELLLRDDEAIAPQHCRIFNKDEVLFIHDLGSPTGTFVDGQRLEKNQSLPLKGGSRIKVGSQELFLQESSRAKRISRKHQNAPDRLAQFMLTATVSILVIFLSQQVLKIRSGIKKSEGVGAQVVPSPYELVQKDLRLAFDQYKQIGQDQQAGKTNAQQTSAALRNNLLPSLQKVQVKLNVVQGVSEFEKRKIELDRKIVTSLIGQVNSMIELQATKNPEAEKRVQQYGIELETLNAQAQAFKNRVPAQAEPTSR